MTKVPHADGEFYSFSFHFISPCLMNLQMKLLFWMSIAASTALSLQCDKPIMIKDKNYDLKSINKLLNRLLVGIG